MKRTTLLAAAVLAIVSASGCDRSSPTVDTAKAPGAMAGMPATQQAGQRPEHMAEGTVNSVDQAAGRVTDLARARGEREVARHDDELQARRSERGRWPEGGRARRVSLQN